MTINTADCVNAIKNSKTINPLLSYANDWEESRNFTTSLDEMVFEMHSASMNETIYVIEHSYGVEISHTRPEIAWGYEIQPYDQWPNYDTILFRVFDTAGDYKNEYLDSHITNLPPGSVEISEGMFTNANFTEHNFNSIMEDTKFGNHTPDLGERPERPEEGCGEDECCGGSCSSGFNMNSLIDDEDDAIDTTPQPTSLFCPICGTQNVVTNPSQNGGDYLYVAEEYTGNTTEIYDAAYPHKCNNCLTRFYMGDEI